MSPDLQTILSAIIESEQILSAVAEFTGLDSVRILSVTKEALPPLAEAGPDEASEYAAAKAKAEGSPSK